MKLKWISPLVKSIAGLPETVIGNFVSVLDALCKKYETTFAEVERQITQTEHTLSGLLDELRGSEFDMQGLAELKKLIGGE